MEEVAGLQIQNGIKLTKLAILQDAFADYQRTRRQLSRYMISLNEKYERIQVSVKRMSNIGLGETLHPSFFLTAWRGFWYLASIAQPSTVAQMSALKCTTQHRKGKAFFFQSGNEEDAPSDIVSGLVLMDWARKKIAVPRVGSKPQEIYFSLVENLVDGCSQTIDSLKHDYTEAKKELRTIQEMNWKTMRVEDYPAKEAKPE
jgi:hypothetical protein